MDDCDRLKVDKDGQKWGGLASVVGAQVTPPGKWWGTGVGTEALQC
jgi:hypothetical protein